MKKVWVICFSILFAMPALANTKRFEREVFFKDTPHELNVYKSFGLQPGNTMLIIGGIQGNEPSGYLAADHFVDMKLEKGTLILVPRANFNTIIRNTRGAPDDMNRKFTNGKSTEKNYDQQIVEIIKQLIAESDVLLNLHEGSGFYRDERINDMYGPHRYGQSIIADAASFYAQDSTKLVNLKEMAETVVNNVNSRIINNDYHFHFNNHNTFSIHTKHAEQRTSATYYALSNFLIPAFGIESSKDIIQIDIKVQHQIWVINEFMKLFDIQPEIPGLSLEKPVLEFIVVSVNDNSPTILKNNQTLYIKKGDEIDVDHIESNYERGLSADVLEYGTVNDIRTKIRINSPTTIVVRKDKYQIGQVYVKLESSTEPSETIMYDHLVVEVNGKSRVWNKKDELFLNPGDVIEIVDTVPSTESDPNIHINFYGYAGQSTADSHVAINTATDLLPEYSVNKLGETYKILVQQNRRVLSEFYVNLSKPKLLSVSLKINGQPYSIKDREKIAVKTGDELIITGAQTNIQNTKDLQVNFKGFVGAGDGEDRNMPILVNNQLLPRFSVNKKGKLYPIAVSHKGKVFGFVLIDILDK